VSKHVNILLVDDHALLREVVGHRLQQEPGFDVVGHAANADEAIDMAIVHSPDIILMDIDMPGLSCFEAARTIALRRPDARIIFLSAFFHDRYIDEALRAEAAGYLTKSAPPDTLLEAIRKVASGGVYFSDDVRSRLVVDAAGAKLTPSTKSRASTLTPRETEVLRYIARGLSKKEIAVVMHVSVKTVEAHSMHLMTKLDIHDRVDLVRFAIREGLAEA